MRPFLRQVVDHYYESASIEKTVFIFPNRRSLAFFRKYLADAVRESSTARPLLEPRLLTISDFFSRLSGRAASDRITLLLNLYECYAELNPKAESLDDFIYWEDVLLGDFDDVDKYLVDARQLFRNISDINLHLYSLLPTTYLTQHGAVQLPFAKNICLGLSPSSSVSITKTALSRLAVR